MAPRTAPKSFWRSLRDYHLLFPPYITIQVPKPTFDAAALDSLLASIRRSALGDSVWVLRRSSSAWSDSSTWGLRCLAVPPKIKRSPADKLQDLTSQTSTAGTRRSLASMSTEDRQATLICECSAQHYSYPVLLLLNSLGD